MRKKVKRGSKKDNHLIVKKVGESSKKNNRLVWVIVILLLILGFSFLMFNLSENKILFSPIENGGFESDLADWSVSGSNVLIDSSEPGDKSLRIIGGGHALAFPGELNGSSGKSFTFSLWAKKDAGVVIENKVGIQGSSDWVTTWDRALNIDSETSNEWVQYSKTFTLPTDGENTNYQIVLGSFPSSQSLVITNLDLDSYDTADILHSGLTYYVDRDYIITEGIPQVLQDQNYIAIKTSNENLEPVSFSVNKDVRVYLAWDERETIFDGWTKTDTPYTVVVSDWDASGDHTLTLYERDFSAGTVSIPARTEQSNYIIFVAPKESIWFDDVTLEEVSGDSDWGTCVDTDEENDMYTLGIASNYVNGNLVEHPDACDPNVENRIWQASCNADGSIDASYFDCPEEEICSEGVCVPEGELPPSGGIVTNGDFETGDLTGWDSSTITGISVITDSGINSKVLSFGGNGFVTQDNIEEFKADAGKGKSFNLSFSALRYYGDNNYVCISGVDNPTLSCPEDRKIIINDGSWKPYSKIITLPSDSNSEDYSLNYNLLIGGYIFRIDNVKIVEVTTPSDSSAVSCVDSDDGLDYYVSGKVELKDAGGVVIGDSSDDICMAVNTITVLKERSCEGLNIKTTIYPCHFGCSEGKCLTAEESVKPVDLLSASIDKDICRATIKIKCLMNDTFEKVNGAYLNYVRPIYNFSDYSFTLDTLDPEPNNYTFSVPVSKTISGKFYAGCVLFNKYPDLDEEILDTKKSDYILSPCPNPDDEHCTLLDEDYDEGDRTSIKNTQIYCYGGDWEDQKNKNADCDEDYECLSDECDRHGECTSPGALIIRCFPSGSSGGVSIGTKVGTQYCASSGSMAMLKSDLAICLFSYECISLSCVNKKCEATAECTKNSDCSTGKECTNGRCLTKGLPDITECSINSDCDADEICNSSGECVKKSSSTWFWWVFGILLVLSIIVLIIIWFVYKNKKMMDKPGTGINIVPKIPPGVSPRRHNKIPPRVLPKRPVRMPLR